MINKKGQVALEFMITYGWAILVVLAVIASLSYIGIFDFDSFLPEKCSFTPGFTCIGKASIQESLNTITFIINNNQGFTINLTGGNVISDQCLNGEFTFCSGTNCEPDQETATINNNENGIVKITCDEFEKQRISADIEINYVDETGLNMKSAGKIRGKAY